MNKKIFEMDDELRPEYDFGELTIVARGPGRTGPQVVTLAPDVAEVFPTSDAVNEALRIFIRTAERSSPLEKGENRA